MTNAYKNGILLSCLLCGILLIGMAFPAFAETGTAGINFTTTSPPVNPPEQEKPGPPDDGSSGNSGSGNSGSGSSGGGSSIRDGDLPRSEATAAPAPEREKVSIVDPETPLDAWELLGELPKTGGSGMAAQITMTGGALIILAWPRRRQGSKTQETHSPALPA